jgi:hypothetical protein
MRRSQRRLALCAAILLGLCPVLFAQPGPTFKAGETKYFNGKVVPLADLLKGIDAKLDPDAAPHWLALVTDDGKVYPLIRDDAAKMFFTDATVRNKPMRITGRLFADTHLLQVLNVHSYKNGQLCEIYYWCDVCAIRRNAGGICECCGGPMVLREEPLKTGGTK